MRKAIKELAEDPIRIVISAVVLGAAMLAILQFLPRENPKYLYTCTTGGVKYTAELDSYEAVFDAGDKLTLLYALASSYPGVFNVEGGVGSLPEDAMIEYAGSKYTLAGKVKNIAFAMALLIIIIPYPAYLVQRFMRWADGVLKGR